VAHVLYSSGIGNLGDGLFMKSEMKKAFLVFLVVPFFAFGSSERDLSSMRFPAVKSVFDTDEMLSDYQAYMNFVCEIGKRVDARNTRRLIKVYSSLRRRSPEKAALFLKGLRFEMISKADLMGVETSNLSTQTPEMRRWVARYMKEWVREADEHLFRSLSDAHLAKAE